MFCTTHPHSAHITGSQRMASTWQQATSTAAASFLYTSTPSTCAPLQHSFRTALLPALQDTTPSHPTIHLADISDPSSPLGSFCVSITPPHSPELQASSWS